MGIHGFWSYCHKGLYWRHWLPYGGVEVLDKVPKDRDAFEKWIKETRKKLDLARHDSDSTTDEDRDARCVITREQPWPCYDTFITYTYELDLDRLVFLVNAQPVFRLDNLPSRNDFIRYIAYDHYGNRAFRDDTPLKYRYNWTRTPIKVHDAQLASFTAHRKHGSPISIAQLLSVFETLSNCERAREQLVELFVGLFLRQSEVAARIRSHEYLDSSLDMPGNSTDLAWMIAKNIFLPMVSLEYSIAVTMPTPEFYDAYWVREDVVFNITTHLEDERTMQAAIGELVEVVLKDASKTGVIYGVAFSIFDCVVVKIDKDAGGCFDYTPVLRFLPSFYADTSSTPGITALARLSYLPDPEIIGRVLEHKFWLRSPRQWDPMDRFGGAFARLPPETLEHIAGKLFESEDLVNFASLSGACHTAASRVLRWPCFSLSRRGAILRVLDAFPRNSDRPRVPIRFTKRNQELWQHDPERYRQCYHGALTWMTFEAIAETGDRFVMDAGVPPHVKAAMKRTARDDIYFGVTTIQLGPFRFDLDCAIYSDASPIAPALVDGCGIAEDEGEEDDENDKYDEGWD